MSDRRKKRMALRYAEAVTEAANQAAEELQSVRHLMQPKEIERDEEYITLLQGAADFLNEWAKPL